MERISKDKIFLTSTSLIVVSKRLTNELIKMWRYTFSGNNYHGIYFLIMGYTSISRTKGYVFCRFDKKWLGIVFAILVRNRVWILHSSPETTFSSLQYQYKTVYKSPLQIMSMATECVMSKIGYRFLPIWSEEEAPFPPFLIKYWLKSRVFKRVSNFRS